MKEQAAHQDWSWREIAVVLFATIAGAVLRFWNWRSVGLSHFDEGIYALEGMWALRPGGLGSLDPQIIPYAPPAFPILIGVAYRILGDSDHAALLVAELLGVATIPLLGWFARRAFGPGSGGAAAVFVAVAAVHVTFSRMVLTDVPFVSAWVLALGCGAVFLERPSLRYAVVLGLCVGLAQYTKYNGWLAGAVVALAALGGFRFNTMAARRQNAKILSLLTVSATVAALSYVPWYLFVEGHAGGYAGLIAHHRSYVKTANAWLPNLLLQLAQGVALSGGEPWGLAAWFAAWIGIVYALGGSRAQAVAKGSSLPFWIALLGGGALYARFPNLGWWVGIAWTPWLLRDDRPGARVAAASWLILTALTPFYHPYARLWLPLHATAWTLLAGLQSRIAALVQDKSTELARFEPTLTPGLRARFAMGLVCAALAAYVELWVNASARPLRRVFEPTDSLRLDMQKLETALSRRSGQIKLLTRPPVLFYLRHLDPARLERLASSSALQTPDPSGWVLVEEIQLRQEGDFDRRYEAMFRFWEVSWPFIHDLGPADLLDNHPGSALDNTAAHDQQVIWLLRPRRGNG
jgi:4-amino-4-deoxy-L-arabinose transferase-like glycosyltransferase